jgi:hypothetical protein
MKMLVRFAPFIAFSLFARLNWRLGVLAGLVTLIGLIVSRRPLQVGVLNAGMLIFFVAAGVLALVSPHSGLQHALHPIAAGWLCLIAAGSIVVGHPFTTDLARDQVPAAVAASPGFLALNKTITGGWAVTFAAIAVADVIAEAIGRPVLGTVATIALLLAGVKWSANTADGSRVSVAHST